MSSRVQDWFMRAFFGFAVEDVKSRYKREDKQDWQEEEEYSTFKLTKTLTGLIDVLVGKVDSIPDAVFEQLELLAREYMALRPQHCEQYDNPGLTLKYSQLHAFIRHPSFVKDKRCLPVFEVLSDLEHAEPWNFNMYVYFEDVYYLREGFGVEHLPVFQMLIDNDKLWQGRSREMVRVFFASVAEAVDKISKDHPKETLPLRLALLGRLDGNSIAEIAFHVVYTFTTEEDEEALRELIEKDEKGTEIARRILSGGYKNVMWAI